MAPEKTATLWIGDYYSECGRCRRHAWMRTTHHTEIPGDATNQPPRPGCGARFTAVGSLRIEYTAERIAELRPDLPFAGHRK